MLKITQNLKNPLFMKECSINLFFKHFIHTAKLKIINKFNNLMLFIIPDRKRNFYTSIHRLVCHFFLFSSKRSV